MKAFELRGFSLDQLVLAERPTPQPGAGEVLVKLRALSLNFRDLLVVQGKYNPRMKLPRVPVSDGAGEVAAVGEGVTAWKPGDRVVVPFYAGLARGSPLRGGGGDGAGRGCRWAAARVCGDPCRGAVADAPSPELRAGGCPALRWSDCVERVVRRGESSARADGVAARHGWCFAFRPAIRQGGPARRRS